MCFFFLSFSFLPQICFHFRLTTREKICKSAISGGNVIVLMVSFKEAKAVLLIEKSRLLKQIAPQCGLWCFATLINFTTSPEESKENLTLAPGYTMTNYYTIQYYYTMSRLVVCFRNVWIFKIWKGVLSQDFKLEKKIKILKI